MDYAALAKTILAHPLTWTGVTLLAAPLTAWVVNLQLKAIGLGRRPSDRSGIAWNLVLAFLVFWIVLGLGLDAVASQAELAGLATSLSVISRALLGLLPAAVILAGADHHRRARLEELRDRPREQLDQATDELRWVGYAAGSLAAVAVVNGPYLFPLLMIAAAAAVLWWLFRPGARARTRAWRSSWTAGVRLRSELDRGARIASPGGPLALVDAVGVLSTDVLDDGQLRAMSNAELLERLEAGHLEDPA